MVERHWTDQPEARRDLEQRGGGTQGLLGKALRTVEEREQAAEGAETNGNGRTGLFVKLTVKQVSIVLGIVASIATGTVALSTHEPTKADSPRAIASPAATVDHRGEALLRELSAHVEDIDGLREEVRDTRKDVRELRGDLREVRLSIDALAKAVRDARRAGTRTAGEGGGSK